MPAGIEIYYAPVSGSLPQNLWPLMKVLQSKIRKGLHHCQFHLLRDIQPENEQARIWQPYSLEPLFQPEPGLLRICLKLLHPQAATDLAAFSNWWQSRRKLLYLDHLRLELQQLSEIQTISPHAFSEPLPLVPERVVFHFLSPVAFGPGQTHQGKERRMQVYAWPLPDRVMASLRSRWNTYYPEQALPEQVIEVADSEMEVLQLDQGQIQTVLLGPKMYKRGFTGSVVYRLPQDQQLRQQIMTLVHFANWSGVGRQSTLGLGWTRTEWLEAS